MMPLTRDDAQEVILVSEALHDQHITAIAKEIAERSNKVRIVLISGPSSSGKTTFSRRLGNPDPCFGFLALRAGNG